MLSDSIKNKKQANKKKTKLVSYDSSLLLQEKEVWGSSGAAHPALL